MGRGEGHGLAGQHGSNQTRGLSWEVAGGAGVPVSGRKARLLRHPHQPKTRDPRALGLRKQTGHTAHVAGARRHLAAVHRPHGTRPRPQRLALPLQGPGLSQARAYPSRLLHFHRPSSSLHEGGATFRERGGAGCLTGQMGR